MATVQDNWQSPRTGALRRVSRFNEYCSHGVEGGWSYDGSLDSLILSVDKDVRLCGVQHFGRKGYTYSVSMEINDASSNLSLAEKSGTYCSENDSDGIHYGFDVLIDTPVILKSGKGYKIISMIRGPPSWYGEKGEAHVNVEGINFTFSRSDSSNHGTNVERGQFPVFLFTHCG
ncbi:BTB/POZ domain-containing protein 2-like [Acropora muricata]|uniref:BTB/POZ domain-containing protein 2-like n=1 Tax=Acropora muricata TaxID=159855 RepID=UPI0034E42332